MPDIPAITIPVDLQLTDEGRRILDRINALFGELDADADLDAVETLDGVRVHVEDALDRLNHTHPLSQFGKGRLYAFREIEELLS